MEMISSVFNYILNDLGSTVVLPVFMMLIGKLFKMSWKSAISSGILLAVAFQAVGLVSGFMGDIITPVAKGMAETIGKEFTVVDGGWAPLASITWSWKYAFLFFPIQIGVNFIMIAIKKTDTLNIDLWNVWGKAFIAYLTYAISGNLIFGILVSILMMVLELILGDAMQPQVEKTTGIEGVSIPHRHMLLCSLLYPVDYVLRKVPFLDKEFTLTKLQEKVGFIFDKHIFGFILGFLFGLLAKQPLVGCFTLGVKCGCALLLLPKVASLFMESLNPIAEAATKFMSNKTKGGRKLFIGLDNPILMGNSEIWSVVIMCMPITLLLAMILPFNKILPFAALDNMTLGICVFMITNGNLLRMLILFVMGTPIYLFAATTIAPTISQLGVANGVLEQGKLIASAGMDAPAYVVIFSHLFDFLGGSFIPLLCAGIYLAGFIFTVKGFKKDAKAYKETQKE